MTKEQAVGKMVTCREKEGATDRKKYSVLRG
jgi:hypothetical protein